jgi:tRNA-specific 2-thiouridylase
VSGNVIGEHSGAFFYTLGERIPIDSPPIPFLPRRQTGCQRRGGVRRGGRRGGREEGNKGGFYVIGKNIERNTLTVSQKNTTGELPQARTEVTIRDWNWVSGAPIAGKSYLARVRYRQSLQEASIKYKVLSIKGSKTLLHNTGYIIQFASPQTVAPGQSLVLYDGAVMLGGGIIA